MLSVNFTLGSAETQPWSGPWCGQGLANGERLVLGACGSRGHRAEVGWRQGSPQASGSSRQVDPTSQGPSYRLPSALSWMEKQTFREGEPFSQGHTACHTEPEV